MNCYNHCLIITAYKHLDAINYLCRVLPPNFSIYVHIDKNYVFLRNTIDRRANVFSFYRTYWGGAEHLKSIIRLLSIASDDGQCYDYYHIISAQDYLAISPLDFEEVLGGKDKNYLGIFPLPRKGWWGDGFDIYQYKTISRFGDIRYGLPAKIDKKLRKLFYFLKQNKLARKLPDFPLYGGSVYCSLSDGFVKWVTTNKIAKRFLSQLSNTVCAEEIYFQTLIMMSPYCNTIVNNQLRYIEWVNGSPKNLKAEDFPLALNRGFLFCRKIVTIDDIHTINNVLGLSRYGKG